MAGKKGAIAVRKGIVGLWCEGIGEDWVEILVSNGVLWG